MKIKSLVVASNVLLFATAAFTFTSCSKDDDDNSDQKPEGYVEITESGVINNDYGYVDLGLPSGTKWATFNLGCEFFIPEDYGDYYAWGETNNKTHYDYDNYKWIDQDSYQQDGKLYFTKYCISQYYGLVDSLTTLEAEDDAATRELGTAWRIPTIEEMEELVDGCDWEWTSDLNNSGVAGKIGTSKYNGNKIFLPANGTSSRDDLIGISGSYWASSLSSNSESARFLDFNATMIYTDVNCDRTEGLSVRAVLK